MTTQLVKQELEDDRRYHPNLGGITRGGLANHYPMTLLALQGLGASDEEVLSFRGSWGRHRAKVDTDLGLVDRGDVTTENWPSFLGQSERFLEFRRAFETLLATTPAVDVVANALRVMRDSLPMGLFHPLIRLAFAAEQNDAGLIADALSYMAIRYANILHEPETPDGARWIAPAEVWRRIADGEVPLPDLPPGRSLRICETLVGNPKLQRIALPADIHLSIPEICGLALRLYLHEPALTTLHAVTSAQALAQLTTDRELWARYFIWLTALFVEKGHPRELPDATSDEGLPSWDSLAAAARSIPEVHLIKMAYSCRWLDARFGPEPRYRVAAMNMIREADAHPQMIDGAPPQAL